MAIKASAAVEIRTLVEALAGDDDVRREAAIARLGIIGPRAVDRLIESYTSSSNRRTHAAILRALEGIGDVRSAPLARTALVINAEHTALTLQHQFAGRIRASNTMNALHWSFNGSRRLIDLSIDAFKSFGVPTYVGTDGVAMAEISPVSRLVPSFGVIEEPGPVQGQMAVIDFQRV